MTAAEIENEMELEAAWDRYQESLQAKARAEKNAATLDRLQSFLNELTTECSQ
jgi:hypothetical protein